MDKSKHKKKSPKILITAAVEVRNADLGPYADLFCKMVLIWSSFAVTGPHLHEKR